MKTAFARLRKKAVHAVGNLSCRGRIKASDIVERGIAEGAFCPIATMRHHQFIPSAVAPEALHGVGGISRVEIPIQMQPIQTGSTNLAEGDVVLFGQQFVFCTFPSKTHQLALFVEANGADGLSIGEQTQKRQFAIVEQ